MKPPTVFLGEMTNREVEAFVADHTTVIVPIGSTEQHGPHGPLLTDRSSRPRSRAASRPGRCGRRAVDQLRAVLPARRVHRRRLPAHPDVHGARRGRGGRPRDDGFRRIVFLNGHYDNTLAIAYACANAADRLPDGTHAFPINYWDGLTADEAAEYFGPTAGLHANRAETSAVMAIDEGLVDLEHANAEMPPFPEVASPAGVHTAFFFSSPGSVYRATHSGTWGDARESSVEYGKGYLDVVEAATLRMLRDVEKTFAAMPTATERRSTGTKPSRSLATTQVPPRITRRTVRSSSSSTRSARCPSARPPRSVTPSSASGFRLAAATARAAERRPQPDS